MVPVVNLTSSRITFGRWTFWTSLREILFLVLVDMRRPSLIVEGTIPWAGIPDYIKWRKRIGQLLPGCECSMVSCFTLAILTFLHDVLNTSE